MDHADTARVVCSRKGRPRRFDRRDTAIEAHATQRDLIVQDFIHQIEIAYQSLLAVSRASNQESGVRGQGFTCRSRARPTAGQSQRVHEPRGKRRR